jgi:hypothetical protein
VCPPECTQHCIWTPVIILVLMAPRLRPAQQQPLDELNGPFSVHGLGNSALDRIRDNSSAYIGAIRIPQSKIVPILALAMQRC